MTFRIVDDKDREQWTAKQVAEELGISRGTFTSYASRGIAPQPTGKHAGLTLWDAQEVRDWDSER